MNYKIEEGLDLNGVKVWFILDGAKLINIFYNISDVNKFLEEN